MVRYSARVSSGHAAALRVRSVLSAGDLRPLAMHTGQLDADRLLGLADGPAGRRLG